MFWKNKVYVFDDVVSSSQQEEIEAHFTKAVPWYFVEDITSVSDAEEHNKRPGFSHPLARDGQLVASKKSASYLLFWVECLKSYLRKAALEANLPLSNRELFYSYR